VICAPDDEQDEHCCSYCQSGAGGYQECGDCAQLPEEDTGAGQCVEQEVNREQDGGKDAGLHRGLGPLAALCCWCQAVQHAFVEGRLLLHESLEALNQLFLIAILLIAILLRASLS
jgi:hypothetical protein